MRISSRSALAAVGLLLACAPPSGEPAEPGNLLVISLDTTRADHLGAYGNPLPISPHLDALAARGVVFENAYVPMPQTLPSHATLFTGLEPRLHGALENAYVLSDEIETLAEVFRAAGYRTAGVIAALVLSPATGIAQGFEVFDRPDRATDGALRNVVRRPASAVTDAALAWADTLNESEPYLLWAHYYDPHDPLDPPQAALDAIDRDAVIAWLASRPRNLSHGSRTRKRVVDTWYRYAAEIRGMDEQVGRLLDGLSARGLLERTTVVVIGDHGEGLFEHGMAGHGLKVYEEQMRVPFIVAQPGAAPAGRRVSTPVTAADVMPTVLDVVLQQPSQKPLSGRSLADVLARADEPGERPVYLERPHFSRERLRPRGGRHKHRFGIMAAVIDDGFKLIRAPGQADALYDLGADPEEIHDLASAEPERLAQLGALLSEWERANPVREPGTQLEVDAEQLEALRALGYLETEGQ